MNNSEYINSFAQMLLRVGLGISFILHGLGKFPLPPERMVTWFESMGYMNPELVTSLVALGEVGAGAGILLGGLFYIFNIYNNHIIHVIGDLITRLSAVGVVIIMFGAFYIAHADWFSTCKFFGKEYELIKFCPTKKVFMSEQIFLLILGLYFSIKGNS
tara:strand:- start:128 stop:604 length:477 start_codon:yes stop_codon:yes gene_type:complete